MSFKNQAIRCTHIAQHKSTVIKSYKIVHGLFVACMVKSSKELKVRDCFCNEESCHTRNKVFACLFCVYFGCLYGKHIHGHAKSMKHFLAMDVDMGAVYCFYCKDFIYDPVLENVALLQKHVAIKKNFKSAEYVFLENENPSEEILANFRKVEVDKLSVGVRGMKNMGNTCFINVILQSLAHAPAIAKFYLSDDHRCAHQMISPVFDTKLNKVDSCFSCEMGKIVQEIHCGKTDPMAPVNFFTILCSYDETYVTGAMGDSLEFFSKLLNLMHLHCQKDLKMEENEACCVMYNIFTGFSETEYTCIKCQSSKSAPESTFTHLSLPVEIDARSPEKNANFYSCLKRCLTQVHVSFCEVCQDQTQTSGNLKFKKLPHIIAFHLYRFNHQTETFYYCNYFVSFDEIIDMTPYMVNESRQNPEHNKFYLFSVIEHRTDTKGNGQQGHYVCYIRLKQDEWYCFDDDLVEKVSIEQIKNAVVYMLFYHKGNLT